jgi:hypothetical protein
MRLCLCIAPACCPCAPTGNITLAFSYPVELAQLAKSLKLTGASAGADSRTLTVSPCPMITRLPVPLIFTAYGAVEAEGKSRADLLAMNSTCAVVKIVPGLAAGAAAALVLPKGARYSPVAGPASQDVSVDVSGGKVVCHPPGFVLCITLLCRPLEAQSYSRRLLRGANGAHAQRP